jgi:hypothetical protein
VKQIQDKATAKGWQCAESVNLTATVYKIDGKLPYYKGTQICFCQRLAEYHERTKASFNFANFK